MIYLLLQIIFASTFTLFIKWAQVRRSEDVITIGNINYIVAALASAPLFLRNSLSDISPSALVTGGSMGVIYFIAFFFVIYAIRVVGASSATVVSVLSMMFPITLATWIWDEVPSVQQWCGIGLAIVALLLIGFQKNKSAVQEKRWLTPMVLLAFFGLCGCSRLLQQTVRHLSVPEQFPTFVFAAFVMAGIPSAVVLIYRRQAISRSELLFGTVMGVANMLQTQFVLICLKYYSGFIVFTVTSAGAIVLTTLIATGLLKERLATRTVAGISLAVIALIMLQWKF